MLRLLRLVDARRLPVIARCGLMSVLFRDARRSRLRTMLRVPRRQAVVTLRLMRIRGAAAMWRRTMFVAARRGHRVNGRMRTVTGHLGAQMLAA